MMRRALVFLILLVACLDKSYGLTVYNFCCYHWGNWEAWSECSSDCFGQRIRSRSLLQQNLLHVYSLHCDKSYPCGLLGITIPEQQGCNEVCHHGGHVISASNQTQCQCQPGYYSSCCKNRVNCGTADNVVDGTVSVSSTYYGGKATYKCDKYYNMTSGNPVRICQNDFSWSGTTPRCIFAHHCNSSPCKNGATCVNLLGDFRCECTNGWGGQLCDQDIQPPEMKNCNGDIEVNATDLTVNFGWNPPEFYDPMGMQLDVVSNYPTPSFNFPWGDHTVQYVATKPSNGMSTECVFQVKVRPTPCEELNVPLNGARVCNNWKTDYGRFCMVTCQQNYTLGPGKRFSTMYVCGASGTWIASNPMPDCVMVDSTNTALEYQPDYTTYTFQEPCLSNVTKTRLQNLYLERLQLPGAFSTICSKYPDECVAENVDIQCTN